MYNRYIVNALSALQTIAKYLYATTQYKPSWQLQTPQLGDNVLYSCYRNTDDVPRPMELTA